MILEIKVSESSIYCKRAEIVSGNGDEASAVFSFDKGWHGYAKTAVMFRVFGTQYSVPLDGDACPIPGALLNGAGRLYIGVYGVLNGKTLSTGFTSVEVLAGAAEGGTREPPDAYAYTRLLEMVTEAVNSTQLLHTEVNARLDVYTAEYEEAEFKRSAAEGVRIEQEQKRLEAEGVREEREKAREARENDVAAEEERRRVAENQRIANEEERIRSCVSKDYLDHFIATQLGDISSALDNLHSYALEKTGGGAK